MARYIFIDNWVLGSLGEPSFQKALVRYIKDKGYVVALTTLSLTELYNPGWRGSNGTDRTARAVDFFSQVPSAVVDPTVVWEAEVGNNLDPVTELPVLLALESVDSRSRKEALLRLLRADDLYVSQGHDIRRWDENYKELKSGWLASVERIIADACASGNLVRNEQGRLVQLPAYKELFLSSLDFRHAPAERVSSMLNYRVGKRQQGRPVALSSVRLSSLLFWYLYVDIDPANRVRHQGSDIGDMFHLSLLPYCAVFTADKSMYRLLQRIREPVAPLQCQVFTAPRLREVLGV
ncbi:MAG: hypothetical protein HYX64_06150 [Gammaproteobacteria bacterium]|nr:hypothetical protein [Gammaproteobacteria bacterium]